MADRETTWRREMDEMDQAALFLKTLLVYYLLKDYGIYLLRREALHGGITCEEGNGGIVIIAGVLRWMLMLLFVYMI